MYWFNKNFINKSFFLILFGLGSMLLSGQNTTTPQATVAPSVQSTSVDTIKDPSLDPSSSKAPWSIDSTAFDRELSDDEINTLPIEKQEEYYIRLDKKYQETIQAKTQEIQQINEIVKAKTQEIQQINEIVKAKTQEKQQIDETIQAKTQELNKQILKTKTAQEMKKKLEWWNR